MQDRKELTSLEIRNLLFETLLYDKENEVDYDDYVLIEVKIKQKNNE